MRKTIRKTLGKLNIASTFMFVVMMSLGVGGAAYVLASGTSNFT